MYSFWQANRLDSASVVEIVWFKRDLRVVDHHALVAACDRAEQSNTAVLGLYVIEPDIWLAADSSWRQWQFVEDCLVELEATLNKIGLPFLKAFGSVPQVLQVLSERFLLANLWSHQETGNAITFARDRAVQAFCRQKGVPWREFLQHPIQRAGIDRDHYHEFSQAFFDQPVVSAPGISGELWQRQKGFFAQCGDALSPQLEAISPMPQAQFWAQLKARAYPRESTQRGGRERGLGCLQKILKSQGRGYLATLAKPLEGATGSSRLSPHLAWGSLSIREVIQATTAKIKQLSAQNRPAAESPTSETSGYRAGLRVSTRDLRALLSRLFWQSHFMQKLETEAQMEFQTLHPLYQSLRDWDPQDRDLQHKLWAWQSGQTGMPMVDACMRCLQQTGWLPFRMRAMVVSFAAYQLWLPWQQFAPFLAALFTDYEPGIHYSQVQMQSGTTGINQMRVYNPVKQAQDHDPQGRFIAKWLPVLSGLPLEYRYEPWRLSFEQQQVFGCLLGRDYPLPVVDHEAAAKEAKAKIAAVRSAPGAKALSKAVYIKHGSRLSKAQRQWTRTQGKTAKTKAKVSKRKSSPAGKNAVPDAQMTLF